MVSKFHEKSGGEKHEVQVREAQEADLIALEWHGGIDLRSFYQASWQSHQNGSATLLVATLEDFPIGQVLILWGGKPSHPHVPDLQSLRVHPEFRGLGIGTTLLDAAEKLVAARGFERVCLSVGLDNPHARRLYEKIGYKSQNIIYDEEWSYIDQQGVEIRMTERVLDLAKELR